MIFHVDNTPDHFTTRPPALMEAEFSVEARGEVLDVGDPDDYCEPTMQISFVKPLRLHSEDGMTWDDLRGLIERAMSPAPCWCEHDCCGHRHGWSTAELLSLDCIRVTTHTARNF